MEDKEKWEDQIDQHGEDAVNAYIEIVGKDYAEPDDFDEAYQGQWDSDEDFVQNLLENTETIPADLPAYIYIDWEATARDVMMDYSEDNGHYFRNL